MQNGKIKANMTKEELDRDGRTLEQLFFDVTEGMAPDKSESADAGQDAALQSANAAQDSRGEE